jgi:peptidoglycan/LPS O-acetylase OafA/YrhL
LVLIFHFDNQLLVSGYIGVDIFFVISGYLITMISLKRVNDPASLKQFYIKRVMRIYPALLFVSFVVILALSLIEYLELESLQMIRDTILANSNFRAEKINLDYFGDNNNNYMLHLWTISIELQFYLFFPLLMLSSKIRNNIFTVIISLVMFSLIILFLERSYYDSLGRMLAFSSGALTYLVSRRVKSNNYIYFLSLGLLIGLSFMDLNVKSYPNHNNIPVIFLTIIALLYGEIGIDRKYKPFIFIGLISYSLYLWHYPLFLFFGHLNVERTIGNITILLALLVSISFLSYHMIEKKFIPRNLGNYTLLIILIPQAFLIFITYYKKSQSFDIPFVNTIYEKVTLNPLLYNSDLANLKVSRKYDGCLDNKGELLTHCSSTKVNSKTKTALTLGNSFVHTGGLVFVDQITAHYNVKSDFYYLFGDEKKTKELFDSVKAGKYDYLILYYPWLNANSESLIKQYKELSQYTQIIFIKGTKYNMDINKKQLFRFNNLFLSDAQDPFKCKTQKPFSTKKGYQAVDDALEELNAKSINLHELQIDKNGDYMCSYKDIALYADNFHINNYAGELFAQWFIQRDLGKQIFN